MNCELMHGRIRVALLTLDDATGFILKIHTVYDPAHLPIGVPVRNALADRRALNDWWIDRSIPASRSGIREALDTLAIGDTRMLLVRCLGLSLSDQYWIRPEGTDLQWEEVNFFDNPFCDDVGDVLFGAKKRSDAIDFSSPDAASDGNLKKRWKIVDGKRCLIKGGSNPFRQQPFNEVIAAEVMNRLGIAHIPYSVIWNQGAPYSVCEDFITSDTELIPAWRILQIAKKPNDVSFYRHFTDCAGQLGIPGVTAFLDRMLVLDYIIANEDRHLNNFGAIRSADTLAWLGMAPVYDNGSSLGYDMVAAEIRSGSGIICKPFKKTHEEQLKLVRDFSWIDFTGLADMREYIVNLLSEERARDYIGEERIRAIADAAQRRIERLQDFASAANTKDELQADNSENDVKKNIAAVY